MQRQNFNAGNWTLKNKTGDTMKHHIKSMPAVCAMAFCAVILAGPSARANAMTGSIGFEASGVDVNSPNLATATTFTVVSPTTFEETGAYLAVPNSTAVSFTSFVFNPPVASVTPLWTFELGPAGDQIHYAFDVTSVTAYFNSALDEWDIGGNGIAMITGYSDTEGTWNLNLSQSGASFVFDSSAAANGIPVTQNSTGLRDGGSTLVLLGLAMTCLGAAQFCRKLIQ
jgi:hypothetical protein